MFIYMYLVNVGVFDLLLFFVEKIIENKNYKSKLICLKNLKILEDC